MILPDEKDSIGLAVGLVNTWDVLHDPPEVMRDVDILRLLLRWFELDWHVLAIAAAKLGFAPVIAFDSEPAALDATRANARANDVELDRVERLNLRDQPPPLDGVSQHEVGDHTTSEDDQGEGAEELGQQLGS